VQGLKTHFCVLTDDLLRAKDDLLSEGGQSLPSLTEQASDKVHSADTKASLHIGPRQQGVPELTNSLLTLSVGDRGFRSRLGLNFTVFYTQQNILFII